MFSSRSRRTEHRGSRRTPARRRAFALNRKLLRRPGGHAAPPPPRSEKMKLSEDAAGLGYLIQTTTITPAIATRSARHGAEWYTVSSAATPREGPGRARKLREDLEARKGIYQRARGRRRGDSAYPHRVPTSASGEDAISAGEARCRYRGDRPAPASSPRADGAPALPRRAATTSFANVSAAVTRRCKRARVQGEA